MNIPSQNGLERFEWKRSSLAGGVVFIAIVLRVAIVLAVGTSADTPLGDLFMSLAIEWRETFHLSLDGNSTAVVMPAYPLFLGVAAMVFPGTWVPVGLLQAILGGLTAWLAYRVAWEVFGKARAAWIVLGLAAFYPPLVVAPARLDPLVVTGFLLTLGIWLLSLNFRDVQHILFFMVAAAVFSAAILITGEVLVLIPFVGLWAGIRSYHRGVGVLCGSAFCLACLVALMPWMGRNFLALGTFVPMTTGWTPSLERSLADLGAEEPRSRAPTDPRGDLEKKIEETGDETFAYQESLKNVWGLGGALGTREYSRLVLRGVTFWISDYTPLLGASMEPTSRAFMAVRVVFMTFTILSLVTAALGLAVSFGNLNAWLLGGSLVLATGLAALFDSPGHRHLAYWPLYAPFLAVGGTTVAGFVGKFLAGGHKGVVVVEKRETAPESATPIASGETAIEEVPPLWPVAEDPSSKLEPIRKTRKPNDSLNIPGREEE